MTIDISQPGYQTLQETIARIKREIIDDVENGLVPIDVESFGDLHDFRDANCYGGLCDENVSNAIIDHFGGRSSVDESLPDAYVDFFNAAQTAVDSWIKDDKLTEACESKFGNEWLWKYAELLKRYKELQRFSDTLLSNLRPYQDPQGIISTARTRFNELRNA